MGTPKITYSGNNADIHVYDEKVVIIRKTLFNNCASEKSIPITSIASVQIIPSKALLYGYITFNVLGEVANSRGTILGGGSMNDRLSENTVVAKKRTDDEIFYAIKKFIEEAKEKASTASTATIIQQATSPAEELKKMKELLDMGIITQEEFDAKKKQLLGL